MSNQRKEVEFKSNGTYTHTHAHIYTHPQQPLFNDDGITFLDENINAIKKKLEVNIILTQFYVVSTLHHVSMCS